MPEASSPTSLFNGTWNATALTMVICGTIAGYNGIEGLILILSTFRTYKGLYFWSLIVADVGVLIYMVFVIFWFFDLTPLLAALLPLYVGWICMVTGQSVVLYSRLGIVLGAGRANILRAAKWMIIVDAVVFHTSTISMKTLKSYTYCLANTTKLSLCAVSMHLIASPRNGPTTIWSDYTSQHLVSRSWSSQHFTSGQRRR